MTLAEIVDRFELKVRSAHGALGREVSGGYASDLMSDVIAHGEPGQLWVTLQIHGNVVAVASLKELAGVVLVNGREPEEETVEAAERENLPILVSDLPSFELAGRLYEMGVGKPAGLGAGGRLACEP